MGIQYQFNMRALYYILDFSDLFGSLQFLLPVSRCLTSLQKYGAVIFRLFFTFFLMGIIYITKKQAKISFSFFSYALYKYSIINIVFSTFEIYSWLPPTTYPYRKVMCRGLFSLKHQYRSEMGVHIFPKSLKKMDFNFNGSTVFNTYNIVLCFSDTFSRLQLKLFALDKT